MGFGDLAVYAAASDAPPGGSYRPLELTAKLIGAKGLPFESQVPTYVPPDIVVDRQYPLPPPARCCLPVRECTRSGDSPRAGNTPGESGVDEAAPLEAEVIQIDATAAAPAEEVTEMSDAQSTSSTQTQTLVDRVSAFLERMWPTNADEWWKFAFGAAVGIVAARWWENERRRA